MRFWLAFLFVGYALAALEAVPVIVASHKLVEGLRSEVKHPFHQVQSKEDVTNMIKRLVTECSSDSYVLLNVPGLESTDLTDLKKHIWPNLVKYMHMASSLVGVPWMEGTLDLQFLEAYITRTCSAETINVVDEEDVHYRDTRKRIIKIDFNPLPGPGPERDIAIRNNDDMLRKVLRKTPSPHYTIILTLMLTLYKPPIPDVALEASPEYFEVFNEIVNDPKREQEEEKHKHLYNEVEPMWNTNKDPMSIYMERKNADRIRLRDYEHWQRNEKLVTTVAAMVVSLFVIKSLGFAKRLFGGSRPKRE